MMIDETPADDDYPAKFTLPPLDLLNHPETVTHAIDEDDLREMGLVLEEALMTFGVEARVTDVTRGPTITRFEVEPAPGIKVNRFIALADDLALALKAHRVRVEAPIPGRGKVGIEVPNETREPVVIRELLESENFNTNAYSLALAMGKEIAGNVATADLAAMPHLLVAGATGSGKTVYVKTILASLLFTKTPDELQLILIDPKMVELSIFNDIPHLITPVVIDPKKAAASLNWLINEMEERYRLFAHLRVRNIDVYNDSVDNGEIAVNEPQENNVQSYAVIRKLPYIVCIIDELADLMMLARAEVEDAIARLAQLARAVGIHLVIATQRPSVDVLTGVIKANFPSRISFQVSSRVDSRCILDEIGAERLIGHGDMLYLPPGQTKPTRLQGAFISDIEMDNLIAYLKTQAPPQYRDEIEQFGKQKDSLIDLADDTDDLFEDAVRVVTETGQASISMVQRRLRVGYTRAARLIDMMELKGIVGPHVGSKAREILVPAPSKDDEVA
ncbi:MAG: Flp pilus assembly complex ATPase component TadA [Candidatus Hydrogenedentes bacterium]|nr:Flp pilus assembly complex ATPase component TadA [Candidatus Hydrogenedentota bacterium]